MVKHSAYLTCQRIIGLMLLGVILLTDVSFSEGISDKAVSQPTSPQPQAQKDVDLELGKPINRQLGGGDTHNYKIRVEQGMFVRTVVDQRGIDVAVNLSSPDSPQPIPYDRANGANGPERVSFVASQTGIYQIQVSSLDKKASPGRYEIQLLAVRPANPADRKEAEDLLLEAKAISIFVDYTDKMGGELFKEAVPLIEEFIKLYKSISNEEYICMDEDIDLHIVIGELGRAHLYLGNLEEADQSFKESQKILESHGLNSELDIQNWIAATNNHAFVPMTKGDYETAGKMYDSAFKQLERLTDAEGRVKAFLSNSKAEFLMQKGDYAEAYPLYETALDLRRKILKPKAEDYLFLSLSLSNMARWHRQMGNLDKAEGLFIEALEIARRARGEVNLAGILHNFASLYISKSDYEKAEKLFAECLGLRTKNLSPDHMDIATTQNNWAAMLAQKGDYEKARVKYIIARDIYIKKFGPDHTAVARVLNNIAVIDQLQGNDQDALDLYEKALKIRLDKFPDGHPEITLSLYGLAFFHYTRGNIEKAIENQARANDYGEKEVSRAMLVGSRKEKLNYLEISKGEMFRTLTLHLQAAPDNPKAARIAYESIARRKGRILDSLADGLASIRQRINSDSSAGNKKRNEEDLALLDRYVKASLRLGYIQWEGREKMSDASYKEESSSLRQELEKIESRISANYPEFRSLTQLTSIENIGKALPKGYALIDFVVYKPFVAKAGTRGSFAKPHYAAYVLRDDGALKGIDLGEEEVINKSISRLRNALSDEAAFGVKDIAREVDHLVMEPLRKILKNQNKILISPDGDLNLVPFEALVGLDKKYLINDYSFTYLSSSRDLLKFMVKGKSRRKPIVIADPDFAASKLVKKPDSLAGTNDIVETMKSLWPDTEIFVQGDATKDALKNAPGPELMVIISHGLRYEESASKRSVRKGDEKTLTQSLPYAQPDDEVSFDSSIILSRGKSSDKDEILTPQEVATFDLFGTRLVILAACGSGIGQVATGNGVSGLRRSITLAGAEAQAITLWSVPETPTILIVNQYLKNLKKGFGRSESLRLAQKEVLKMEAYEHPYNWAGFIASGNWNSISDSKPPK